MMDILIAFLVILAVALLAGVLLLVFSRLFAVEKDPTEEKIRACLPGINCGACGYKGCDDYAAALAKGGVNTGLCVPGAQKVADEISEILGVESVAFNDVVAYVSCNGTCEATPAVAVYEGVQSCRAASMLYGGANACRFGCLGLGDCAAVCPSGAICFYDGIAHVNTALCIGCGLCARTCPKHVITMLPQDTAVAVMCSNTQKGADARKACKNACIGCRKCEKACPHGAITVENNLARIDYTKCEKCGLCADACPTGCLKKVFFPNLPEDSNE
ncbi:MAG: RnfABCDGE type electron transport complex subunit B [Clostridia bacterium]|nr:RnfABCDGE type electron transport complex subunit B [Clostridia bacterium]MBR6795280.1 RnfABCDGE type electron transport complex subunit B [Clostridia bacterium]